MATDQMKQLTHDTRVWIKDNRSPLTSDRVLAAIDDFWGIVGNETILWGDDDAKEFRKKYHQWVLTRQEPETEKYGAWCGVRQGMIGHLMRQVARDHGLPPAWGIDPL